MINPSLPQEISPVKTIRDLLGLSQKDFALLLGVHETTISRWETGKATPTFTVAQIRVMLTALKPLGVKFEHLPDDMRPGNHLRFE